MTPADLYLLQTYGPWVLVAILVIRDLVPFLRDKLFPEVLKGRQEENDRRWSLSERQVMAYETIAKAMQQMTVLLATLDARIEVMAGSVQRVEMITTEINTRSRGREQDIPTERRPAGKKTTVRNEIADGKRF